MAISIGHVVFHLLGQGVPGTIFHSVSLPLPKLLPLPLDEQLVHELEDDFDPLSNPLLFRQSFFFSSESNSDSESNGGSTSFLRRFAGGGWGRIFLGIFFGVFRNRQLLSFPINWEASSC